MSALCLTNGAFAVEETQSNNSNYTLQSFLTEAQQTGFMYAFNVDNQYFDGKRSVSLTNEEMNKLASTEQGTLLVKFKTSETANQVIFAAGTGTATNQYGAVLANTIRNDNVRIDFPGGMVANLSGPKVKDNWRTFVYSVDASGTATQNRTVTSIDGSTTTQYPNFASWYSKIPGKLSFAQIGKAPGTLAKSGNNVGFKGEIAYVAFVPRKLTQQQAAQITTADAGPFKVFERGDATESGFFRIPFLIRTKNDTLIAGADANRGTTGDSADNIDAAVRIKQNASSWDASSGWMSPQVPFALDMQDYENTLGYKPQSASVIDGAIVQDKLGSGRIILHIDLFPWNGGFFEHLNIISTLEAKGGRVREMAIGNGFAKIEGRNFLLLSTKNQTRSADGKQNNINMNVDRTKFDLVADVYGPKNANGLTNIYKLNGTPRPYSTTNEPVSDDNLSLGTLSEYSLDSDFVLYKNGIKQFTAQVGNSAKRVPLKVMYKASPLQMYNTSYFLQVYSDDEGQTWHTDQLVSAQVKRENSEYYLLGPGAGLQISAGTHAGRILMPVYYRIKGESVQKTEVIYSDDGGQTWHNGNPIPTTLSLHEATMVELPNGGVQIFVRNTSRSGGQVVSAVSNDGGETWLDVKSAFGDNQAGVNSQVSSINLSANLLSKKNGKSLPAFVVTSPASKARVNGIAHVGVWHEDGKYPDGSQKYLVEWINEYELTEPNIKFAYSSMTELANGKLAILYETSPTASWPDGLQSISYREISIENLLKNK